MDLLHPVPGLQKPVPDQGVAFSWADMEASCPGRNITAFISSRLRGPGTSPVPREEQDLGSGTVVALSSSVCPLTCFLICQMEAIIVKLHLPTLMEHTVPNALGHYL